jgi:phage gpG-like protein
MGETAKINIKGLEGLIKSLKGKTPVARIGILGDGASRNSGAKSNAEIGAVHEFGSGKMPQRSFLRVPIAENLEKFLASAGAFDKEALALVVKEGSLVPYIKRVATVAEAVVFEGFDTGGFGKWPPSNMAYKKVHQTLVETQQLRNSITSEVIE